MTSVPQDLSETHVLDFEALEGRLPAMASAYQSADPFPHVVINEFLDPAAAERAGKEFPAYDSGRWNTHRHVNELKSNDTDPDGWGPTLQAILADLNSARFVSFVSKLTGIEELLADPSLEGGGLHQSARGGFLNVHADFTVHPLKREWRRRVNLLLYFNDEWKPEYGGDLELWATDMSHRVQTVPPVANRAVIFTTNVDSYHGHPEPLACPPDMARRSLALYYFVLEPDAYVRSTEYRARPGDGAHGVLIYADKMALRAFDWSKRHLGVSDEAAVKLMDFVHHFGRKKSED